MGFKRRPSEWTKNLLVLLGAIVLVLGGTEIFVRFYEPQILAAPGARESFHPPIYQSDDRLGYGLRPGVTYDHQSPYGDFSALIQVNEEGFRDRPVSLAKAPGTFRVFVLGDSFPFGMGVNNDQAFPARLETLLNEGEWRREAKNLPRFEMINTSVPGYNLPHYYLTVKLKAPRYEPDLILLSLLPWNDFDLGEQEWGKDGQPLLSSVRVKFDVDPEGRLRQREDDHLQVRSRAFNILPTPVKDFLRQHSHLYHFLGERYYRLRNNLIDGDSAWVREAWAEGEKLTEEQIGRQNWRKGLALMEGIQRMSETQGVRMAVVIIPHLYQSHEDVLTPQYVKIPKAGQELLGWFEGHRLPYLNLVRSFDPYDEYELYLKHDKHFTVKGHELAARFLLDFLLDNSLIPKGKT